MAIPPTPKPQFPNVPTAPGVPPVLRKVGAVQNSIVLLVADAAQVASLFDPPQWGLFTQDGAPAFPGFSATPIINSIASGIGLANTSVGDLAYRREYRISTAPQEEGAFRSYNKVQMPFDGRVTYLISGLAAVRSFFLQQLEALSASLTLLDLVMPEITYLGVNIMHHDFRRTARRGVQLIAVDIWVEEVRITGTSQFSNAAQPNGADPANGGAVQPLTPAQGSNTAGGQIVLPAGGLT